MQLASRKINHSIVSNHQSLASAEPGRRPIAAPFLRLQLSPPALLSVVFYPYCGCGWLSTARPGPAFWAREDAFLSVFISVQSAAVCAGGRMVPACAAICFYFYLVVKLVSLTRWCL